MLNMRFFLRTTLTCLATLASFVAHSQTTVFTESFDPPSGPDSVWTYHSLGPLVTVPYWNDTSALAVSGPNSYHAKIVANDSIIFRTDTFSTVGNIFVRLTFDHIAKVHFGQQAWLRVSNDGGQTWTRLVASHYDGSSAGFPATSYFNELSYANPNALPYWGGLTPAGTGTAPTAQWWANETFDVSSVLGVGPSGTGNGYANCLVEFILEYRSPSGTANPAGWFVDNVKVDAAPCELNPPTITFDLIPRREPIGARYQLSQIIELKALDAESGIDSVVLFTRLNGGAWNDTTMTPANAATCPDSSIYSYSINSLIMGDSMDWYVEVYDCACPNMSRAPSLAASPIYNTFWIDPSPPIICGVTTSNSFPSVVTSFPWVENFSSINWIQGSGTGNTGSSHRGIFPQGNPPSGKNWSVSPNPTSSGFGWSVRQGATGTANTGPLGDHTTGGGKYLYTEVSQGNANNNTLLITPCIKLTGLNHAVFEFWYHKYGQHMGNLRVDIDTGSATPKWVVGVMLVAGQKHSSSSQPWSKALINLDPYLGQIIRVRFLGNKNNSSANDMGDIAIDDLSVYEPDPADIEMVSFLKPNNGFCQYTSTEDVRVHFRSEGFFPIDTIPLAFSVTNLSTSVTVTHRDTVYRSMTLGDTATYTFSPKADLSAYSTYHIYAWSEAPGDPNLNNDTIGFKFIEHIAPITGFPAIETFDGPGWVAGNGSAGNAGTFNTVDWEVYPASNSGEFAWMVGNDLTATTGTGPRWSWKRNDGNYIYAEGSYGSNSPAALFRTVKCVDLTGLTNPTLSFWYYLYGSDINILNVQVVPNGSNNWQTVAGAPLVGQKHVKEISDWKFQMVDLSAYVGQVIKIRILARKIGGGDKADMAIDDLVIYDRPATDLGVSIISSPLNSTTLTNPQSVIMKIRNYGSVAKSNIPITYQVNDLCTSSNSATYTTAYTGSIPAGGEVSLTVSTPPTYYLGEFEVKAWTMMTGDGFAFNDTASKISSARASLQIPVGPENFDNCIGDELGFFTQGGLGTMQMWEHGTPAKPGFSGAASGSNAWVTGRHDDYQENSTEILRVPTLLGFDTIQGAELRFKQKFSFATGDGGKVEYFQGGQWNLFGTAAVAIGVNWYGSSYGASNVASLNSAGWAGSTGGSYIASMLPLNIWNYNSNPLMLRFVMKSGAGATGKGWSIDDFEVYVPPQNSASAIAIDTREYLIIPADTAHLRVRIENTGAKPLDSCLVRFQVNGGAWSNYETVIFKDKNGNITPKFKGQKMWYDFEQGWLNGGAGSYSVCIETFKPDSKLDDIPTDDQLCITIDVLDEIAITTGNGYCNDFETSTTASWVALHANDKKLAHDWEFGTPNQTQINAAASGSNAWVTFADSNYSSMSQSAVHTPFFYLNPNNTYSLSFKHNMLTEQYHDGGSVDWSYDGGVTWYTLGNVLQNGLWYNTVHVTSLDIIRPGWSGNTNGWITSTIKFTVENAGKLVFRFRFGADFTLQNEGWAIDDFCLEQSPAGTPADIVGIGMDEDQIPGFFLGHITPNPVGQVAQLQFNGDRPLKLNLRVIDLLGKEIMHQAVQGDVGHNSFDIDVSAWANGMYTVIAEVEGGTLMRKFIVQH